MPERGEKAPQFSLPSTRGDLTLERLLMGGKLVLAFYAEDNTPT